MSERVADFLLKRLSDWGVKRIFGYPGDGINGILGALERAERHDSAIDFVQVRHEEMAAFMACGHAKFTGEVGVCLATSGPGAIHLLNGLYDAKMDHQPVVAIVGQQPRRILGGDYQQEVDLLSLFKDVAKEYVHMVTEPSQLRHLVDRAFRIARLERTVTCIIIPKDVQEMEAVTEQPHEHFSVHTAIGYTGSVVVPTPDELRRAADVLNAGRRVAMLVGAGALHATDEVIEVAQRLGAGVAKALLGKAAVPDDVPFVTGAIGLLGTKPSWEMMSKCDTLLMVGSNFPYPEFLPEEGQARGVQIDIDGRMLGLRYPMEVNLVGDSAETLRALLPMLDEKRDRTWQEKLIRDMQDWWSLIEKRSMTDRMPLNPQRLFWELSDRLPERCIVTTDSGTSANWFGRNLRLRRGMMASLSGNLATMGPGVPYAIGAKFAHPDRVVVALVGDGAMQMNGMNELITVSKYWHEWDDPRLVVLVLDNADLNQVTWEMRAMEGDPKYETSQNIPDFPYARYAELLGLGGIRVERPEEVGPAWDRALTADRPVLIEAHTDPNVPTLPPRITFKEAKAFASAIMKGDPEARQIIRRSFEEAWPI